MNFKTKKRLYRLKNAFISIGLAILFLNILLILPYFFGNASFEYFLINISILGFGFLCFLLSTILSKIFDLDDSEENTFEEIKEPIPKEQLEALIQSLSVNYKFKIYSEYKNEACRIIYDRSPYFLNDIDETEKLLKKVTKVLNKKLELNEEMVKSYTENLPLKTDPDLIYPSHQVMTSINALLEKASIDFQFYWMPNSGYFGCGYLGLTIRDFEILHGLTENFISDLGYFPEKIELITREDTKN